MKTPVTYRQYATAVRDIKRAEYGITVAEAAEFYPDHVLRPDWVRGMIALAEAGVTIPASVARTMSEDERYAVNKFGYSFDRFAGVASLPVTPLGRWAGTPG